MKFGLMLPNYARWFRDEGIWDTCKLAQDIGFDALCFVDHVIFTRNQYVGFGNGYMDIWTAMSYVAAITNIQGWRPILTQTVVDIPYRPPVQQAKVAATVDSLSGGRLMIGAGAGYVEEEFRALSLDITKRGEMTHEYLDCMKELWSNPVASFHGKYANFDDMTISIRPVQQPYPPILYGSHGPGPRRRIAERYQGSIGAPGRGEEAQQRWDKDMTHLNRLWNENGRVGKPYLLCMARAHLTTDRDETQETITKGIAPEGQEIPTQRIERMAEGQERVYVSNYNLTHVDDFVADLRRYEDLGMDMAIVWLPSYGYKQLNNRELQLQQMELFAESVLPRVNHDSKPIEMDFAGKIVRPFAAP
jgi:alkanesulfonate monooxygenase SsuD/methylene tetrahydromethanopterin reductase-like flavin-dependent oxidoreductase (luciferase family)